MNKKYWLNHTYCRKIGRGDGGGGDDVKKVDVSWWGSGDDGELFAVEGEKVEMVVKRTGEMCLNIRT